MKRFRSVAHVVLLLALGGCIGAWMEAVVDPGDAIDGAFIRGIGAIAAPAFLSPWLARRLGPTSTSAYELLSPADRAQVDTALATGVPPARATVRSVAHDVAVARLAENPRSRSVLWGMGGVAALLLVGVAVARVRPGWLLAVTAADLAGWALLLAARWPHRAPDLPPDERARLLALRRAKG